MVSHKENIYRICTKENKGSVISPHTHKNRLSSKKESNAGNQRPRAARHIERKQENDKSESLSVIILN